jgi:CDP-diacylglycerol---serine O-phosphatidyltransferase
MSISKHETRVLDHAPAVRDSDAAAGCVVIRLQSDSEPCSQLPRATNRRPKPSDTTLLSRQLTLANVVTSCSLIAGLAALLVVSRTGLGVPRGRVLLVSALILLAAVFDAVDGPLARYRNSASVFGATLDSLADVVSFGVTPALATYFSALYKVPVAGALGCVAFSTAAAWRLARFQVCGHKDWFIGCPVPLAAVIVALVGAIHPTAAAMLPLVALLSWLMISTVPCPTWAVAASLAQRRRITRRTPQSGTPLVAGISADDSEQ